MSVKKIPAASARHLKKDPGGKGQPGVRCKTASGKQYLILPGQKPDTHILWEKTEAGDWVEKAISESPTELSDLIDFHS